ncbi:MAG: class I SAM-dependent methyltransferase [Thermoproteales archaeon]|nr:class I SAM-dependent methyltransferase [Thermoproteales archaeon]
MSRKIIDIFNRYAEYYDDWYKQPLGQYVVAVESMALSRLIPKEGRGVELGCGTGVFAKEVYRIDNIKDILCLDPAYNMLKRARMRGLDSVCSVIKYAPFRNEIFDFVFMVTVVEFLDQPLDDLISIRSFLKKNGWLIIMFINRDSSWGKFYIDLAKKGEPILSLAKIYSFDEIKTLLEKAGFVIHDMVGVLDFAPTDNPPLKPYIVTDRVDRCGAIFVKAQMLPIE